MVTVNFFKKNVVLQGLDDMVTNYFLCFLPALIFNCNNFTAPSHASWIYFCFADLSLPDLSMPFYLVVDCVLEQ